MKVCRAGRRSRRTTHIGSGKRQTCWNGPRRWAIVGRLTVLPRADRDIDDHFLYIANDRFDSAIKFLVAVRADMNKLCDMPGMGPVWGLTRSDLRDVRFWPIGGFRNFLIFHRPTKDGIEVLRVIHGARDIE